MSSRDTFQPELFNDNRSIILLKGLRDVVAISYLEVLMPQSQLLEGEVIILCYIICIFPRSEFLFLACIFQKVFTKMLSNLLRFYYANALLFATPQAPLHFYQTDACV